MKTAKLLSILGASSTFGFGLWHFTVPSVHQWFSYIPEAPTELLIGISATNFFLSLELLIFGLMGLNIILLYWDNKSVVKIYLGYMSALWTIRFIYQLIEPQGSGLPLIWQSLIYGSFIVTALCFVIPLVMIMRKP